MAEQTELQYTLNIFFLSFKTELMFGEAHVIFTDELRDFAQGAVSSLTIQISSY